MIYLLYSKQHDRALRPRHTWAHAFFSVKRILYLLWITHNTAGKTKLRILPRDLLRWHLTV